MVRTKILWKNSSNNYIINCSSSGIINGGGILGDNVGEGGSLSIIGCSSSGLICTQGFSTGCGGIVGQYVGYLNGDVTIMSCWSTGSITNDKAGGIVGSQSSKVQITNCYSIGEIGGNNSGGIIGPNAGSTGVSINNCYSQGNITGEYSGGICGSLSPFKVHYYVMIRNCYSSGNISNGSSGGICGMLTSNEGEISLTISHCYTSGILNNSIGYIIGDNIIINGVKPSEYLLTNNYSEAANGGSGWNNLNANTVLIGTPNLGYSSSSIWQTIFGNGAYELFNMGYTPYSTTNISNNDLIRTSSETVIVGSSTNSAIRTYGPWYTFLSDYSPFSIYLDPATGVISTKSSTPIGEYTLYIYNTGSYNITTYTLKVENSQPPPPPPPPPTPSGGTPYYPVQHISLNQKSGFCGTRSVSSTAVGIGTIRGKGSATRIFNNCKGNNNYNFQLCQFRVLGYK